MKKIINTLIEGWKQLTIKAYNWRNESNLTQEEKARLLIAQDNGAIIYMSLHDNEETLATFNTFPYRAERITRQQYDFYKRFMNKVEDNVKGIKESYSLNI